MERIGFKRSAYLFLLFSCVIHGMDDDKPPVPEGETGKFYRAVERGFYERVVEILRKWDGKNVVPVVNRYGCDSGLTPLMAAARLRNVELVSLLLGAGADVSRASTRAGHNDSVLHYAIEGPFPPGARWLVDGNLVAILRDLLVAARAKYRSYDVPLVSHRGLAGDTPLTRLYKKMVQDGRYAEGQMRMMRNAATSLLRCGADPNAKDDNGRTLLMDLASRTDTSRIILDFIRLVSQLTTEHEGSIIALQVNASSGQPDFGERKHALHFAMDRAEPEVVEVLLQHGAIPAKDIYGDTPLHALCGSRWGVDFMRKGQIAVALLSRYPSLWDERNAQGSTALRAAAWEGGVREKQEGILSALVSAHLSLPAELVGRIKRLSESSSACDFDITAGLTVPLDNGDEDAFGEKCSSGGGETRSPVLSRLRSPALSRSRSPGLPRLCTPASVPPPVDWGGVCESDGSDIESSYRPGHARARARARAQGRETLESRSLPDMTGLVSRNLTQSKGLLRWRNRR